MSAANAPNEDRWDIECEVLVVGSGGGGCTAAYTAGALGLDTLLIEKTDLFGGTTAYSGATLWLPATGHSAGPASTTAPRRRSPICARRSASRAPGIRPERRLRSSSRRRR
ncbi:FAD-dependent oxidoreductase [Sphaerimonospora cavernae]|uniref:FAD-dependent oxidoreductase n=1 Tax=Sphaerimonospora cavernae TaxID=1740611 RepID=A0ABV6U9P0_9ACTN